MNWKKTKESLPADKQEILIRYAGTTNMAIYDASKKSFLMENGSSVSYEREMVEWMPLGSKTR